MEANKRAEMNARQFFSNKTEILVHQFDNKPKGYDIGDYVWQKYSPGLN